MAVDMGLARLLPRPNVRPAGEDYAAGGVAARAGDRLTPARLGVLASIGGFWTGVGVAMVIGLGIMVAVSRGLKSNIEIKR